MGYCCQHCLTCTEKIQNSLPYFEQLSEFSTDRPWWPSQLPSPTLYFLLGARKLQYSICHQQGRSPWRPSSETLPHLPSLLLAARHHSPISITIPSARTNIRPEECSVQYSRTIYVTLHQPHHMVPTRSPKKVRPQRAGSGSAAATVHSSYPHIPSHHDHLLSQSRARPPRPPHHAASHTSAGSSQAVPLLPPRCAAAAQRLAPPCRRTPGGPQLACYDLGHRGTSSTAGSMPAAPWVAHPGHQPSPGLQGPGPCEHPNRSYHLAAGRQDSSSHAVHSMHSTQLPARYDMHPLYAQDQGLRWQAPCLDQHILQLLREGDWGATKGSDHERCSPVAPLLVSQEASSGSSWCSPSHVCVDVDEQHSFAPRFEGPCSTGILPGNWVGLKRKIPIVF